MVCVLAPALEAVTFQLCKPTVMGKRPGSLNMISGRKKLVQMPTKPKSKMVTSAGVSRRRVMVVKMRNSPAPSMRPASTEEKRGIGRQGPKDAIVEGKAWREIAEKMKVGANHSPKVPNKSD